MELHGEAVELDGAAHVGRLHGCRRCFFLTILSFPGSRVKGIPILLPAVTRYWAI